MWGICLGLARSYIRRVSETPSETIRRRRRETETRRCRRKASCPAEAGQALDSLDEQAEDKLTQFPDLELATLPIFTESRLPPIPLVPIVCSFRAVSAVLPLFSPVRSLRNPAAFSNSIDSPSAVSTQALPPHLHRYSCTITRNNSHALLRSRRRRLGLCRPGVCSEQHQPEHPHPLLLRLSNLGQRH